jgi:hypothetical protein
MAFDEAMKKRAPVFLPSAYKIILVIVTLLTAGAGLADIVMAANWIHPTPMQQSIFDSMGNAWKMGFGGLLGLLGGKAINSDQ